MADDGPGEILIKKSDLFGVYVRAALAILVPAGLWALSRMVLFAALLGTALSNPWTKWTLVPLFLVLCSIEFRYLAALRGLVKYRGSATRWLTWRDGTAATAARRRRRFAMAAAAMAGVVALLIAETAFRLLGLHDPSVRSPRGVGPVLDMATNRLGIREDWDSIDDSDARFRVAIMGDSMTFVRGVPREQGFVRLVQERLKNDLPQGVQIINLGWSASAPAKQLEFFSVVQPEIKAKVVVHVLYPNDLGVELSSLVLNIHLIQDEPFYVGEFSYVLHFIELKIREYIVWNRTVAYFRGGLSPLDRDSAWTKLESNIRACRDAARESGATYGMIMFPWLFELDRYPIPDVHVRMRELAARLDVPYFDLLPTFDGKDASIYRISGLDEHPNARGHQVAAEPIAEFIRREFLKPPP